MEAKEASGIITDDRCHKLTVRVGWQSETESAPKDLVSQLYSTTPPSKKLAVH
jgi:hypothetical protein